MKNHALLIKIVLFGFWVGMVAGAGAEIPPVSAPVDEQVTLQADLTANGSTLVSIPLDLGTLDVGRWLMDAGLSSKGMHSWNSQTQGYVPLKTVRPGEGFLLARGPGKIPVSGKKVTSDTVEFLLNKGWNLIGIPYETSIPLISLRIIVEGKMENYPAALEQHWLGGVNSLVDGKMSPLVVASNPLLEPWRGYWLYAYQSCKLIIPSAEFLKKDEAVQAKPARKRPGGR